MGTDLVTGGYVPDEGESFTVWPTPFNAGIVAHDTYHQANVAEYGKKSVWIQDQAFKSGRPWIDVAAYNAKSDGQIVTDGAMTSGSAVLTSASGRFTGADVGKYVRVAGAGALGASLETTISVFTNATTVTLAASAGTTVSNAKVIWATNDTTPVLAAVADWAVRGGTLMFNGITVVDDGALYIDAPAPNGMAWGIAGNGGALIVQSGTWGGGFLSSLGRHSFGNQVRVGSIIIEDLLFEGNRSQNGTLFGDLYQTTHFITRNVIANNFLGSLISAIVADYLDVEITGDSNGKLGSGAPTILIQEGNEGGVVYAKSLYPRLKLALTNNFDHGVLLSKCINPKIRGYVIGSGIARSAVFLDDCEYPDLDGDFLNGQDDCVHVQSGGDSKYGRFRGNYSGAVGGTPGTGGGINIASATSGETQVGHDPRPTSGTVLGWVTAATADVATSETTTSTSYVALATAGPTVTVQTSPSKPNVRVTVSAEIKTSASGDGAYMSFDRGATGAADADACGGEALTAPLGSDWRRHERTTLVTGLADGSHPFTAKYRAVTAGTATFKNRRIVAEAVA